MTVDIVVLHVICGQTGRLSVLFVCSHLNNVHVRLLFSVKHWVSSSGLY